MIGLAVILDFLLLYVHDGMLARNGGKGKWIFWNHPAQEMKNHKSLISRGLTNLQKREGILYFAFTSSCTYKPKQISFLLFHFWRINKASFLFPLVSMFHCCQVKKALCLNFEGKKKQNCADNRDQDFSNTLVNYEG